MQELQTASETLQRPERLLAELQRGLLREGHGHAARLQLVARTIPAQAWVTEIRAEDLRLELSGYTLEPAALNGWMARLADSPLLEGQQLSAVMVERAEAAAGTAPRWAYALVTSVVPRSVAGGEGRP